MPTSSSAPTLSGTDRLTPYIVFFGPPHSGKSSLIRAFLAASTPPGQDAEVFAPNDPPGGLQRELVPHLIRFADPGEQSGTVVVCDCDGRAAGELLSHPTSLVRGAIRGALAGAVRSADALVLVVDAAATPEEVDATFRAFGGFLDGLEEGRAFGREVGGLPVFLTLTKCDALYRDGDDPTDWLGRVEARKREVESRFEDYFGDEIADASVSPYLPFGSIDLHLAATAVHTPDPPAFEAYADTDGSFGVADLVEDVLPAARAYRTRLLRGRQRLRVTVAGAGGLVGLMVLGAVALVAAGWSIPDPLTARVLAYQTTEGPPAVRLSDRNLPRNRRELAAVREAPRFNGLPDEIRGFVNDRLKEFDTYREFRGKFQPPRIGRRRFGPARS